MEYFVAVGSLGLFKDLASLGAFLESGIVQHLWAVLKALNASDRYGIEPHVLPVLILKTEADIII